VIPDMGVIALIEEGGGDVCASTTFYELSRRSHELLLQQPITHGIYDKKTNSLKRPLVIFQAKIRRPVP
jgi:hypothetical protein